LKRPSLGKADGINGPAGHSSFRAKASTESHPGVLGRIEPAKKHHRTSGVTQEFFETLAGELSFTRLRRPTDNALTEWFYGTVKQEEIYLVGNYPDEISAREVLSRSIETYNQFRPHQALFNFTPAHVHQLNNKSALLQALNDIKRKTRDRRKAYWAEKQKIDPQALEG
jgi:transposase InsO family protein